MKVLGIESSCDETAAAVVEGGANLSSVVATQIPFHATYNGVVPEIARRKHAGVDTARGQAGPRRRGLSIDEIDGIAATSRPG
jgi:N6-L-threonylcarbamoyladenine synthase